MDLYQMVRDRDFVGVFVMNAIGTNGAAIFKEGTFDPHNMEVRLTVNGIECDPVDTIKRYEAVLDRAVERRALELLNERVGSLASELREFEERIKAKFPWSEV